MGIRTPGLLIANETLYQLSYTPELIAGAKYALADGEGKQKRQSLKTTKKDVAKRKLGYSA